MISSKKNNITFGSEPKMRINSHFRRTNQKNKRASRLLKKSKKKLASSKKTHKVTGMKRIPFTSVVWREGKYYVAQCLNVDISSFGTTKTLALKSLKEALSLYLEGEPGVDIREIEAPSLEVQHV